MTSNLIEVHQLYKQYPKVQAVNGVDFVVPEGVCFGLLGPNGAGKTTTIEMLEGITAPSSGTILYKGEPLGERFRTEAGIQFQATSLQDFLTVREQIQLFSGLYTSTLPVGELVQLCALESYLDRDALKLSGGQRQRLLLALALVNNPEVVFLDEPTTGLDPQARLNFWELVKGIKARGKTVLLTTHYMEEAYHLCDTIAIMDHGKIIAHGSPDQLLAQHFNDVVLELPKDAIPTSTLQHIPHHLVDAVEPKIEILTQDVNQTIAQLLQVGVSLTGLRIRQRTLDDLFLALTGKGLRA
jgi:ABC-2 type transport system ATP-binding protein